MNHKNMPYLKGFTRRSYIDKAHEMITRDGIQSVSIRKIAEELHCSSASLYHHFQGLSELIFYAELRILSAYIHRLNMAQKNWTNPWQIYVGVWDCYASEAFRHPRSYHLLFFEYPNTTLQESIKEYYEMYPEDIQDSNQFFSEMLLTPDFLGRDFEMCKKCIDKNAITYENAVILNRMVCMLYKGYLSTILEEGIDPADIDDRVCQFVKDVDIIAMSLASDLKGYTGYSRE